MDRFEYDGEADEEDTSWGQYSCLRNPIDRGAWWAADMSEQPTPYSLYARLQEQLLPYWNPLG